MPEPEPHATNPDDAMAHPSNDPDRLTRASALLVAYAMERGLMPAEENAAWALAEMFSDLVCLAIAGGYTPSLVDYGPGILVHLAPNNRTPPPDLPPDAGKVLLTELADFLATAAPPNDKEAPPEP